jgi:hypothetical protein
MHKNAGVFIGDNSATGWDSNNKCENSISQVTGAANVFTAILTLLNDNDFIDTPIVDSDVEAGPTAQA